MGPEGKRKLRLRNLSNDQLIELYDSELVLRLHNPKYLSDTQLIIAWYAAMTLASKRLLVQLRSVLSSLCLIPVTGSVLSGSMSLSPW